MDNEQPLVSVIIPLFNAENYISETLNGVINQTYEEWEVIVVDDCSTDASRSKVQEFVKADRRIRLIESKENFGGPARPRNIGMKNSNGIYVAFLDADDVWKKDKLSKQIKFMEKNNLNFSSTRAITINEESKKNRLDYLKNYIRSFRKKNYKTFIKYKFIYLSSVIIHKELLIDFSEEDNCIAVEDFYLWLQILNKESTKYSYFEKALLNYRVLNNSISERNINGKQSAKASYYLYKYILDNNKFELMKDIK